MKNLVLFVLLTLSIPTCLAQQPSQAAPPSTTPVAVQPKESIDTLRAEASAERAVRIDAQGQIIQLQAQLQVQQRLAPLQSEFADAKRKHEEALAAVRKANGLGPDVTYDVTTGVYVQPVQPPHPAGKPSDPPKSTLAPVNHPESVPPAAGPTALGSPVKPPPTKPAK